MTDYREILRMRSQGFSQRSIALSCGCSRNTVADVFQRSDQMQLDWEKAASQSSGELQALLFPERQEPLSSRRIPDCERIHREMAKPGVTLTLLWQEYCQTCREHREIPLMYTQFCNHYRKYAAVTKATMHIHRKPGESMEVDWAGQTAKIVDRDTGESIKAFVFVAVLSSSLYAYVEAFLGQDQEAWIAAHVHAYRFFGGVARILTPDNLKTGVETSHWYTPLVNRTYHEMAEHYGTAVIPARVRKPKDKPNVEGAVGVISTWILAAIRNEQFFTLESLNEAIREKLETFNARPFKKKPGSRLSTFLEEEKAMLQPLPVSPYEMAIWKIATVQFNYHISVEKMFYSVPYEYIRHQVDVCVTRSVIEVFFQNHRICSHPRLHGRAGQYSTSLEHMPDEHREYQQWNGERFIKWAEKVGPSTAITVKAILSAHKVEQQGYRACMGLLKLGDRYSLARLEAACARVLTYTPSPGYRNVSTVLKSGQDKAPKPELPAPTPQKANEHSYTRGAEYYGRAGK